MQPKPCKIKMICVMKSNSNHKTLSQLLDEGFSFKEINNYFGKCLYDSYKTEAKNLY